MDEKNRAILNRIFKAQSLVIVGASLEPMKFGGMFLKAILDFGFKGQLYPLNPRGGAVQGIPFIQDWAELPEGLDLAAICVPREQVVPALKACLERKIAGAEILTAGFKEVDDGLGAELEREITAIARQGIRVIGPNCFGIYCPASGLTLLPGNEFSKQSGPVGFISQSGGVCADLGPLARGYGLYFSQMVSYGNGCDLNAPELLDYLAEDPETKLIGAYLEGVADGRRFLKSLAAAAAKKPVIIWKAGLSETGRRAAASHTGSLAGRRGLWEAVFAQTGALPAEGFEEFCDLAMTLLHLKPWSGNRLAVVGGGGALAVEAADDAEKYGLAIPAFSPETQAQLKNILPPPGNSVRNPVDVGHPMIPAEILGRLLDIAAAVPEIDAVAVVQIPFHIIMSKKRLLPGHAGPLAELGHPRQLLAEMRRVREQSGKPLALIMKDIAPAADAIELAAIWREYRDLTLAAGFPVYPNPQRAFRALSAARKYYSHRAALKFHF